MSDYHFEPVATGLGFIEGPVAMPDGCILFTDVSGSALMRFDPMSGNTSRFARTGGGPNGAARGPDGAYYVCNNGGMSVSRTSEGYLAPIHGTTGDDPVTPGIQRVSEGGKVEQLYTECDGRPLIAPNDLVFDSLGGFYFTDTGHVFGRTADLGGIFYAKADGSMIMELVHEPAPHIPVTQPNGCGLSPDGNQLYVVETGGARLWGWGIESPGKLRQSPDGLFANGARFIHAGDGLQMYDSLAIDDGGNICVATIMKGGISVISPSGGLVDFAVLPKFDPFPTNICFAGPDLRDAYVTAAGTGILYRTRWPRAGLKLNHSA